MSYAGVRRWKPIFIGAASGVLAVVALAYFSNVVGITTEHAANLRFAIVLNTMIVLYLAFAVLQRNVVSGLQDLPGLGNIELDETRMGVSASKFLLGFTAMEATTSVWYGSHPELVVPISTFLSLLAWMIAIRRAKGGMLAMPEPVSAG